MFNKIFFLLVNSHWIMDLVTGSGTHRVRTGEPRRTGLEAGGYGGIWPLVTLFIVPWPRPLPLKTITHFNQIHLSGIDLFSFISATSHGEMAHRHRSVKLATSSQLLVAGYLFREKLATSSQLLVTRKS